MLKFVVLGLLLCATSVYAFNEYGGAYTAYTMEHAALLAVLVFFMFGMAASWLNKGMFMQGLFMTLQTRKAHTPKDGSLLVPNDMTEKLEFLLGSVTVYSILWFITDLFLISSYSFFFLTDGIDVASHWIHIVFSIFFVLVVIVRHFWPMMVFLDKPREHTMISNIVVSDWKIFADYGYIARRGLGMFLQAIEVALVVMTFILLIAGMIYNAVAVTPFYSLGSGYANTVFGILALIFFFVTIVLMAINVLWVYTYMTLVQPAVAYGFSSPINRGYTRVRSTLG